MSARYAFVVPRFGESVAGGAETLVRNLAQRLAARGDRVEVFTTCAVDNRTWENSLPAGTSQDGALTVHRFPVDARSLDRWIPLQIRISEGMRLTLDEQFDWLENGVNASRLYATLAAREREFRAVFLAPYLFGTTFFGALSCPGRAVLIPCLHDEHYAYVDAMQSMFRQVRGCLFNAGPEMDLARGLYGHIAGGEVGMGFDAPSDAEVARLEPYFAEKFPYVLYVGRKETGKNAHLLIDAFIQLKAKNSPALRDLRLVIVGGGEFKDLLRPEALLRSDIIDLAHLSERDKQRLIRHARLLCQPSTNESFSIVLMEAWLLGTPVVVNSNCPVTRAHAIESGGGLYFSNLVEFEAVIEALCCNHELREKLAEQGRRYVHEKYSWAAVLGRFDRVLEQIESAAALGAPDKSVGG